MEWFDNVIFFSVINIFGTRNRVGVSRGKEVLYGKFILVSSLVSTLYKSFIDFPSSFFNRKQKLPF